MSVISRRPQSASPMGAGRDNSEQHERHSSSLHDSQTPNAERLANSGRSSAIGGRSTIVGFRNPNQHQQQRRGSRDGAASAVGTTISMNSWINPRGTSSIGGNGAPRASSSSGGTSHHHHSRHQDNQLFAPGSNGVARRALFYDVERHKLESLPLTRLFRFLADRPHWLADGGGAGGGSTGGGAGADGKSDAGTSSKKGGGNNQQHRVVIKNLVVASPEGGRHVSKRQRDIDRARLASVLADRQDDLIIPDTIVWEASIPRGWFFTSFDGTDGRATVQRRSVDIGVIEKQWTEGLAPHAVAACFYTIAERDPAASLSDKDTPLLQFQFLRACELSRFLHVQATQTSGSDCAAILQQFTQPLHAHNVVIQAVWSPRVLNITIRQNINALHDDRLDANSRACTFEGSPHLSLELRPTTRLYGQVESAIHSLTKHFAAVDLKNRICRLVAYFKVDKESRLSLLYVPSIRVLRTALIERPTGIRASPFFSSFRVALDVAVEYETLSTNANAFMAPPDANKKDKNSSGHHQENDHHASSSAQQQHAGGGGTKTSLLGGGGSRIRKSAANKNENSPNNQKNKLFEGSRLLADALDMSLRELNLDRQSQAKAMQPTNLLSPASRTKSFGSSSIRRENSSFGNESSFSHDNNMLAGETSSIYQQSNKDNDKNSKKQQREEESIQYQLDHSPVIGQQRADLVEIVVEIVKASHGCKEAAQAVTRAYRHAATPGARDALKWAAVEAGMTCRDDDGYSHPFFEIGPELREAMLALSEDYRKEAQKEEEERHQKMLEQSNNNGGATTSGNNNNNNGDALALSPSGSIMSNSIIMNVVNNSNPNHSRQSSINNNSNNHRSLANSFNHDHQMHAFSTTLITSPVPISPNSFALSPQQQQQHKATAANSIILPSFLVQATMTKSPPRTPSNNISLLQQQFSCWSKFSHQIKSGVNDFLYEILDSCEPSDVASQAPSSSVFGGTNNLPCNYFGKLSAISKEAAAVCDIVLETCRSAATHAKENNITHPSVQRSLPIAVGHLWRDVSLRDAIAICACAVFGMMYVPNLQQQQQRKLNPLLAADDLQRQQTESGSNVFYLQLKEKERIEKEKEKERKRQQLLKEHHQQEQLQNHENENVSSSSVITSGVKTTTSASSTTFNIEKQEDFSIYYEGLSNATPLYSLSVDSILRPEGTDLLHNATTYSLDITIKNATQLGLECQVRKFLGDVFLALGNTPLDLLLPEVADERRKQQLKEQQLAASLNRRNTNSPHNSSNQRSLLQRRTSNSVIERNSPVSPLMPNGSSSPANQNQNQQHSSNLRQRSQTVAVNTHHQNHQLLNTSQTTSASQQQGEILLSAQQQPAKLMTVVSDSSESEDEL